MGTENEIHEMQIQFADFKSDLKSIAHSLGVMDEAVRLLRTDFKNMYQNGLTPLYREQVKEIVTAASDDVYRKKLTGYKLSFIAISIAMPVLLSLLIHAFNLKIENENIKVLHDVRMILDNNKK